MTDALGTGGRRVTLRTGPVTFWDALEQFCKAADLREWDGLTTLGRGLPPGVADAPPPVIRVPGQIQAQVIIGSAPTPDCSSTSITFTILRCAPSSVL